METKHVTVAELIERLSQFPPEATIGIKSSCCPHTHSIALDEITASDPDDYYAETQIVINNR